MGRIWRWSLVGSVVLLGVAAAHGRTPPAPTPVSAQAAAQPEPWELAEIHGGPVDEYLDRATRYGFAGAALVARDGKVLVARGYGLAERDGEVPNTAGTRFDIGSISKQFTAAAILRLEMQGKLRVDDPVVKFFDETVGGNVPTQSTTITLHQLMSHTSGLHGGVRLGDVDTEDRDAVVAAILSSPSSFKPGTAFGYANPNYFVLAAVIERVSGKPFEQAMRELIFEPAGMVETTFCGDFDAEEVAHGYEDIASPGPDGEPWEPLGDIGPASDRPFTWGFKGATGVLTTVRDLYRWHLALHTDAVLSAEAKKKFFTVVRQNYAYGWEVHNVEGGGTLIKHGGTTPGFESLMARWVGPDGSDRGVVILLLNSRRGLAGKIQPALEHFVLASPGAEPPLAPPKPADVPAAALEQAAGVYRLETGGAIELTVQEGKLIAIPVGQDASALLNLPTQHLAPVLARASQRAGQLLGAWVTRDEAAMKLYRREIHEQVPEGAADHWADRWSGPSHADDPLAAVETLGSFVGEEGLQSVVRLRYGSGKTETVRIFWKQDLIYGIGSYDVLEGVRTDEEAMLPLPPRQAVRAKGLAVELVAESETSFAAMEPAKWLVLRILLDLGPDGSPTGLRLITGEQSVAAKREP